MNHVLKILIVGLLASALICKRFRSHHSPSYNKKELNELTQPRAEVVIESAGQLTTLNLERKANPESQWTSAFLEQIPLEL